MKQVSVIRNKAKESEAALSLNTSSTADFTIRALVRRRKYDSNSTGSKSV